MVASNCTVVRTKSIHVDIQRQLNNSVRDKLTSQREYPTVAVFAFSQHAIETMRHSGMGCENVVWLSMLASSL